MFVVIVLHILFVHNVFVYSLSAAARHCTSLTQHCAMIFAIKPKAKEYFVYFFY